MLKQNPMPFLSSINHLKDPRPRFVPVFDLWYPNRVQDCKPSRKNSPEQGSNECEENNSVTEESARAIQLIPAHLWLKSPSSTYYSKSPGASFVLFLFQDSPDQASNKGCQEEDKIIDRGLCQGDPVENGEGEGDVGDGEGAGGPVFNIYIIFHHIYDIYVSSYYMIY